MSDVRVNVPAHEPHLDEPAPAETASLMDSVSSWATNSLVYLLILAISLGYQHRLGFVIIVGLLITFLHANSHFSSIVNNTQRWSATERVLRLVAVLLYIALNTILVHYVFSDQQFYISLCLWLGLPVSDVWQLLWRVITTDTLFKLITVGVKALITLLAEGAAASHYCGRWYAAVEHVSQLYRKLLPVPVWLSLLGLRSFLGVIYILVKIYQVGSSSWKLLPVLTKLINNSSLSSLRHVSEVPQQSAGDKQMCLLCHREYSHPVQLPCQHVFCELCTLRWLNHDRNCPLCRVKVIEDSTFRDGSTSMYIQWY